MKRKKLERQTNPQRQSYKAEFLMCQACSRRRATDVHEIARGSHREEALKHVAAWLVLCRECHEDFDDYRIWPIARQCALKMVADPARFDLKVINELRGRSEGAIDMADVVQHVQLKQRKI